MLVLVKTNEEAKDEAETEITLMRAFNLSYSELQELPIYVLNCWVRMLHEEKKRAKFEADKLKCQNRK